MISAQNFVIITLGLLVIGGFFFGYWIGYNKHAYTDCHAKYGWSLLTTGDCVDPWSLPLCFNNCDDCGRYTYRAVYEVTGTDPRTNKTAVPGR